MKEKQGRQPGYRLKIVPSGSQHATLFNPWVNGKESVDWGCSTIDSSAGCGASGRLIVSCPVLLFDDTRAALHCTALARP